MNTDILSVKEATQNTDHCEDKEVRQSGFTIAHSALVANTDMRQLCLWLSLLEKTFVCSI